MLEPSDPGASTDTLEEWVYRKLPPPHRCHTEVAVNPPPSPLEWLDSRLSIMPARRSSHGVFRSGSADHAPGSTSNSLTKSPTIRPDRTEGLTSIRPGGRPGTWGTCPGCPGAPARRGIRPPPTVRTPRAS